MMSRFRIASFDELADDYMSKPFSLVILEKRIASAASPSAVCQKIFVAARLWPRWIL
ncbi:hypothetical protein KOY48_03885 [Candidatus Minimicrobia naudis]|uniref:Uncharacterized protein n=1 Tax=Candidatus Minimicrobia naudis TaxID=2841263 RepID=A0A8F1SB03_9BACT|nr:hypothetical protein KOY48_03885 [Candidatus Minimicrobia naudis]